MDTSIRSFLKEKQSINDTRKWILCPKCRVKIPNIKITLSKCMPLVIIHCICSEDTIKISLEKYLEYIRSYTPSFKNHCSYNLKHPNAPAEAYCLDCEKRLCGPCIKSHSVFTLKHQVINRELHLDKHCLIHEEEKVTHYCIKCNKNICSECIKSSHNRHDKKEYKAFWEEIENKGIDIQFNLQKEKYKEKNKILKTEVIHKLEKIITEIKEAIQLIEKEYEINEKMNSQICDLIAIAIANLKSSNHFNNYYLINNVLNLTGFNKEPIKIDTNEPNYTKLIQLTHKYFKTNFIIHLIRNYSEIKTLKQKGNRHKISALLELSDTRLVSGSGTGVITIWRKDIKESDLIASYHTGSVNDMCQLANGNLVSCSIDSKIILYKISSNAIDFFQGLNGHKTSVCFVLEIKNNQLLLSGSYDNSMILWDLNSFQNIFTINEHSDTVMKCIQLSDKRLVSCSLDETIRFWDLTDSKTCSCSQIKAHSSPVYTILQLSNSYLISGGDTIMKLWNVKEMNCVGLIERVEGKAYHIIQFDEDTIISIGSNEGVFQIWNIKTLLCVQKIAGHSWTIESIIRMKNGQVVTASKDSLIKVWELF